MKIRKNSDTRKAKSRDAARVRRGNESEIFSEIGDLLPVPKKSVEQMDKISILRLAVCYLKSLQITSDMAGSCHIMFKKNKKNLLLKSTEDSDIEEILDDVLTNDNCIDGFFMIISKDGSIVFSSESVTQFLGIHQLDMMGNDIHDFTHLCDHQEIDAILSKCDEEHALCQNLMANSFYSLLRLKSTLTGRGKSVNIKQAVFKVLRLTGKYMKGGRIACVFESLPNPNNLDNLIGQDTFLCKHSLDMKFTFVDKKVSELLGFSRREIISNSFYNLYHVLDAGNVLTAIKNLFLKGQSESSPYRLLCKSGGYVWIVSEWTLVRDTHSQPSGVVSINYVISRVVINQHEVLSELQVEQQLTDQVIATQLLPLTTESSDSVSSLEGLNNLTDQVNEEVNAGPIELQPIVCPPVTITSVKEPRQKLIRSATVTTSVFAPRTEDMNSGFLMPDERNAGLTIVDDVTATDPAQDLTHLAPEAGDSYIPLDLDNLPSFDGLDMEDLLHDIDLMNASRSPQSSQSDCQGGSSLDDGSILDDVFPSATNPLFNSLDFPCRKFEDAIAGDSDSGISSVSGSPSDPRQESVDKLPNSVTLDTSTDRVSPLNNDPFLYTGNPSLDVGRTSPSTFRTAPSTLVDDTSAVTLYGSDRRTEEKESSVWDSPPSSSSSSFGTSDLDLCADLDDAHHRGETSRTGEEDFPLLNDESIWESFVRSSLSDIMSPDGLLPENRTETSNMVNSMKPPPPPLPLTSNLAMLLQQTLPQVKSQAPKRATTKAAIASSSVTKFISEHAFNKANGALPNIVVQNGLRSVRLTAPAITLSDGQLCGNHFILSGGKLTTSTGEGIPTNSHIIINYDDLSKKSKGITSVKTLQIQGKVISSQNHSVIIAQNLKRSVNEPPSPAVKKFRDSTTEPMPVKGNSVLMNLLVNGEDVNNGYSRSNNLFNLGKFYAGSR